MTDNAFKPGVRVIDVSATLNGWPDNWGVVLRTDGPPVEVKYPSGTVRWKAYHNLRLASEGMP